METPDNQEEKISLAVRKAGYKVEDMLQKLDISKQTWYNKIRKIPIDPLFKQALEKEGVKLDEKSIESQPQPGVPIEKFLEVADELRNLNKDLNQRLKNEIAYEKEITELRLRIQELEFRLKQG
jgi:protoporphyrinogen oxidase